mgnify:FL=1
MEDKKYEINWLGLFIKVIVFVVAVLLIIWLISKLTLNKGLSIEENLKLFNDSSVEYFKKNLPEEGETSQVTLNQLIKWDYLKELKDKKGKTCDKENSKSTIVLEDNYYNIKTELKCNKETKTSEIKLGNSECEVCDIKIEDLPINKKEDKPHEEEKPISNETSKGGTSPASNNTTNTLSTPTTTILYEYVKNVDRYSDWYNGKVTGKNIENSTKIVSYSKYCQNEELTYYTISYTTYLGYHSYTLELINLNTNENVKLLSSSYFTDINDYINYLNKRNESLSYVGGTNTKVNSDDNPYDYKNHALTSNNFTFNVSNVYKRNGKNYVDITMNINNFNGVTPYYLNKINKNIYYIPIKFTLTNNKSNCVIDKTENSSKYTNYTVVDTWNEYTDIYRYKITTIEYKYSNQESLEGYTKTGKTKVVNN